jgi:hypothetical protein
MVAVTALGERAEILARRRIAAPLLARPRSLPPRLTAPPALNAECVVDLYPEVADRVFCVFELRMSKEKLNRSQIARILEESSTAAKVRANSVNP